MYLLGEQMDDFDTLLQKASEQSATGRQLVSTADLERIDTLLRTSASLPSWERITLLRIIYYVGKPTLHRLTVEAFLREADPRVAAMALKVLSEWGLTGDYL